MLELTQIALVFVHYTLNLLDNTFLGTLFAGLITAYFATIFYHQQKKLDREVKEIRELNNKTLDRLVDILELPKKSDSKELRKRLEYSAFRLKKYDPTLTKNIEDLCKCLKNETQPSEELIDQIRRGLDILWYK